MAHPAGTGGKLNRLPVIHRTAAAAIAAVLWTTIPGVALSGQPVPQAGRIQTVPAAHYSPTFTSGTQDYRAFAQQKKQVNAGRQWVKVKVDRVSMFLYPGKERLAVVTFEQDYSNSNLANRLRKRQYWIKEGSGWKIIHEGAA